MRDLRVLIFSNHCFSRSDSNGRTLGNFFAGWDTECLAQFSVSGSDPDFSVCRNYFCVSDREALYAIFGKKCGGRLKSDAENDPPAHAAAAGHRRNALTMMLRNGIWNLGAWKSCGFSEWVRDFSPQVVLLQTGDCAFMMRLARKTAAECHVPLLIYNSEDYYFKKHDYFRGRFLSHWVYPIFAHQMRREFCKTQNVATHTIYNGKALQSAYRAVFSGESSVLYTSTALTPFPPRKSGGTFVVSYLGNLGVGRHLVLAEIAAVLQELSPACFLDVYGNPPDETVRDILQNTPGIRYHGSVPYAEVVRIMERSDLLVHAENFSDYYRKDLRFAFSTKIADCLAVGRCFLLYAPEDMASYRYLRENALAYTASTPEELRETLHLLLTDEGARSAYLSRALAAAKENHNLEKNRLAVKTMIRAAVEK